MSPGPPAATRTWRRQRGPSPRNFGEGVALLALTFGFSPPEPRENKLLLFQAPGGGTRPLAAPGDLHTCFASLNASADKIPGEFIRRPREHRWPLGLRTVGLSEGRCLPRAAVRMGL